MFRRNNEIAQRQRLESAGLKDSDKISPHDSKSSSDHASKQQQRKRNAQQQQQQATDAERRCYTCKKICYLSVVCRFWLQNLIAKYAHNITNGQQTTAALIVVVYCELNSLL